MEDERRRRENEVEESEKAEEEKERSVREFEMTMMGLEGAGRRNNSNTATDSGKHTEGRGVKRKFELDREEMSKNMNDERAKARKAIEDEKVHL